MKKAVSLLVALVLLLASCGMGLAETKATEVVLWSTLSGGIGEALQDVVNAYNASQDTYFVNYIYSGSYNDTNAKLVSATAGNRPDICVAAIERIPYFADNKELLVPVQKYITAESYDMSDFIPCMVAAYTDDNGEWLAFPLGNSAIGVWYNADLLSKAGYTPDQISNYEMLFECCAKMVDEGLVEYGAAWDAGSIYVTYPISQQGIAILDHDNGKSGAAEATMITQDEQLRGLLRYYLETIQNASKNGLICSLDTTGADKLQMFINGQVAFYANTVRSFESIEGSKGEGFNYGFTLLKTMKKDADYYGGAAAGPGMFICNNGNETAEAGAWDFFKFYAESEHPANFAMKSGYLPVTNAAYNSEQYQAFITTKFPSADLAYAEQRAATEKCVLPAITNYADYNAIIVEYVKLVAGDTSYDLDAAVDELAYALDESCMLYVMQK